MTSLCSDQVRLAVAETSLGFFDYSPDFGLGTFDQNVHQAFGMVGQRVELGEFQAAIHPEDLPQVKATLDSLIFSAEPHDYHVNYRTIGVDDHLLRNVSTRGTLIREKTGGRRIVGTVRDVTAELIREQSLHRARSDFIQLAEASIHDLQDPMRNLMLCLDLARATARAVNSDLLDLLEEALSNSRRLSGMISEIYDFASISQAARVGYLASSEAAVSKAVLNLRTLTYGQDVQIEWGPLPDLPVQEQHLVQLFQHLLHNSFQYRKPDRALRVNIRAATSRTHFVFSVKDDGMGFSANYASRVFGMFKRLHPYGEIPGMGMGLAICARIVHSHGGDISADAQLGEGACITFTIPVQAIAA